LGSIVSQRGGGGVFRYKNITAGFT